MDGLQRWIHHQLQQKQEEITTYQRQQDSLLKEIQELVQALQLIDQNSKRDEAPTSSTLAKRQKHQPQQRN